MILEAFYTFNDSMIWKFWFFESGVLTWFTTKGGVVVQTMSMTKEEQTVVLFCSYLCFLSDLTSKAILPSFLFCFWFPRLCTANINVGQNLSIFFSFTWREMKLFFSFKFLNRLVWNYMQFFRLIFFLCGQRFFGLLLFPLLPGFKTNFFHMYQALLLSHWMFVWEFFPHSTPCLFKYYFNWMFALKCNAIILLFAIKSFLKLSPYYLIPLLQNWG